MVLETLDRTVSEQNRVWVMGTYSDEESHLWSCLSTRMCKADPEEQETKLESEIFVSYGETSRNDKKERVLMGGSC